MTFPGWLNGAAARELSSASCCELLRMNGRQLQQNCQGLASQAIQTADKFDEKNKTPRNVRNTYARKEAK